jgi:Tfp pilus assembly protein PilW
MFSTRRMIPLLALAAAAFALPAGADQVQIPVGSQGAEKASVERPGRGTHRDTVVRRYGQPLASTDPVGDPPISRLEYADFFVYFEYDRVIHTVLRRDG